MKAVQPLPKGFFRRNRERLVELLRKSGKFEGPTVLFLSGPRTLNRNDDDAPARVIFEPFFYYLFGVTEETDVWGTIELATGKAVLFARQPDPSELFWSRHKSLEELKGQFEVDEARWSSDLGAYFDSLGPRSDVTICLNTGVSPVSRKPTATPLKEFAAVLETRRLNQSELYPYGREARLIKSKEEVDVLREAIEVAAFSHRLVMRAIVSGMTERQLSDFYTGVGRVCRADIAYPNIFCAGANGAFLHYVPSPDVPFLDGQLCLNDSGAKIHGYNSDITRTFPVNGKFSKRQRQIYDLVLLAQAKGLELTKPGVPWIDSHNASLKTIANGLVSLGLVTGPLDDQMKLRIGRCFMPHGLGHYIGLYVHDMPGLEEYALGAIKRSLCAGMVITVEPGIYFNEVLLEQSYANPELGPHLVRAVIDEYKKEVGGVRIEDMYLITENGYEDLSRGLVKTADEIEALMRR